MMKRKAVALRAFVGIVFVSAASAAPIACSDHDMTVGSGPAAADAASPAKPTTVWSGYATGAHFLSGSDRVTFTFTSPKTGTVVFGDTSGTVAPVFDHTAIYPAGCPLEPNVPPPLNAIVCTEHFAFTMTDVTQERDRLRLTIDLNELWVPWCRAQTRIVWNRATYIEGEDPVTSHWWACAPGDGPTPAWFPAPDGGNPVALYPPDGGPSGSPDTMIDYALEHECMNRCNCTTSACDRGNPIPLAFDLHISAGEATGETEIGTVYLTAQP
jgi:hypothetical protein